MKKSQTALEFSMLVGFLLFFFVTFFLAIQGNMADKTAETKSAEIKELALNIQDEINLALGSTDGYSRNFTIPEYINGKDYEANITDNMIYVAIGKESAIALPVAKVTGNIKKGENRIRKLNGEVLLN